MKMKILTLLVITAVFSGCSTLEVMTTKADGTDLSQYKTFGFSLKKPPVANPAYFNEINQNRVKKAISSQLANRGYKVDENPDLVISIYLKIEDKQSVVTYPTYYGGRGYYGYYGGYSHAWNSTTINYTQGTLIVDLVDSEKQKLIWQGVAADTVNGKGKNTGKKINEAITKMFKEFPVQLN